MSDQLKDGQRPLEDPCGLRKITCKKVKIKIFKRIHKRNILKNRELKIKVSGYE